MMRKLKACWLSLILVFSLMFAPAALAFNPLGQACSQGGSAKNDATCKTASSQGTKDPIAGPNGVISKAVSLIAFIAGFVAVIMIIISGFRFITAGGIAGGQRAGDPNGVKNARATLTASIIGLIVIVLSWSIIQYVITHFIK